MNPTLACVIPPNHRRSWFATVDFFSIEQAFEEAIAQGVFPGAVVLIGRGEEVLYERAFGSRSLVPAKSPMQAHMIFDLASLTKPLATTLAVMLLVKEEKIRLDDSVTRFIPGFGVFDKSPVTLRQLLNHSSGLSAWKPFYEEVVKGEKSGRINFVGSPAAKRYVLEQIHHEKLLSAPGTESLYSDLGFMILGEVVELVTGCSLDRFCSDVIFKPLGLRSTSFIDLTQPRARPIRSVEEVTVPTENCPWRKKILCGEVHDDNAFVIGGVAGHAGLFSSVQDIHGLVARMTLSLYGKDDFFPKSLLEEFLTKDKTIENSTRALGWDTPTHLKSASGRYFSPRSVGHLGFTGPSLWWDLEKNCHVILLNNRIHPTRTNDKIKDFRPYIHDLIMKSIQS
jgi:CubicO group peptidase (beta-lactamase class C family)